MPPNALAGSSSTAVLCNNISLNCFLSAGSLRLSVSELIYGYQHVDLTIQPNAVGKDVTEATVRKVNSLKIVANDHEYLLRLAYVESQFGDKPSRSFGTANETGGIWQVSNEVLLASQDTVATPSLTMLIYKISAKFRINWYGVRATDLTKPLYSALAAQLYTKTLAEPIPDTMAKQADYWAKYYHPGGSAKVFTDSVTTLLKCFVCRTCTDSCNVLDGSGSIVSDDFEKARKWIRDRIEDFYTPDISRFCLVLFSDSTETVFKLDDRLTKQEVLVKIDGIVQPRDGTNTRAGMIEAQDIFKASAQRLGVPKQIMVLTDGQSNDGVQPAPGLAKAMGIKTMAWGVGPGVNQTELLEIANGDPDSVDLINNYDSLFEKTYKFKTMKCSMAQKPPVGTEVADNLLKGEKRFYNYQLGANGITVNVGNKNNGQVTGYFSFTLTNPTAAENDGQFTGSANIVKSGATEVFVAIEGSAPGDSHYSIKPNAMGRDVAEASVRKVNSLKIVADDHEFLLRLSYVESGYGCSYASLNTTGGLWGVSSAVFLATQDPEATPVLTKLYFKISSKFRINWLDVTEAELTKPLYSALAAMLYTKTLPEPIPDTMAKQADYWAKYYHPGGSAKVFTNLVTTMQNSFVCRTRMDTCFVLDGSGSIAKDDFEKARKWITIFNLDN
ncbi:unnamed protein product, partial [Medioppia subpectinata]